MRKFFILIAFGLTAKAACSQTLQTVTNNGSNTSNIITLNSGVEGLGLIGNTYLSFKNSTNTSRNGYIQHNGTNLVLSSDVGNIVLANKIGIGVAAPNAKLDISGSVAVQSSLTNASPRPVLNSLVSPGELRSYSGTGYQADDGFLRLSSGGGTNPLVQSYIDLSGYSTIPDMNMNMVFGTSGMERMRIHNSGNVGIGTSSPTEKLSVKGKIRAQEVKVEMANWADFVFAKDYVLPTLQETEKHIKEKGHLPGIPSAAEVEKNGIELGDMNKKLLQKIEELTLYLIEMKKENEAQTKRFQSEIESLKSKN